MKAWILIALLVPGLAHAAPESLLAPVTVGQRVFVHINNTNPTLIEGSPQRREAETAGWAIAHDGMAFSL